MQAKLRSVDCVLELHDARIPFSGRNPNFADKLVRDKPHILILNKVDLITREASRRIKEMHGALGNPHVIFTNCKDDQDSGIKKVINKYYYKFTVSNFTESGPVNILLPML
jgi:ribosome biogenesis GTPase A